MPVSGSALLYAEDLRIGEPYLLGSYALSRDDVLDFARAWDPQPFHLDDEFAASHGFGGIIASGLQTAGIFQRLAVTGPYADWAVIVGKAIRDMTFPRPVRPGMVLTGSVTVTDVVVRDGTRSLVHKLCQMWDQNGDKVFSMLDETYLRRRPG